MLFFFKFCDLKHLNVDTLGRVLRDLIITICRNGHKCVFVCVYVLACECHENGSLSGVCHLETGLCDCKPHVSGQQCDRCLVRHLLVIACN